MVSTPAATFEALDDLDAINKLYRERRWSDGLPIVPPTRERVARMLAGTRRKPDEVIATLPPGFGEATVERIAINAVMAGCDPEYLPVLIAATGAVAEAQFNIQGIEATTNSAAVWLVLNGPIVQQLEVNATFNCLGQGTWANATLGRAMRLILQNIGGALPGDMDRATQGQPAKYTFCCGESEAQSPWEPLHVERGFARDVSTVTVVAAEGTLNMNTHSKEAGELLRVIAESMVHPTSNEYCHGGEPWLVFAPEHADILKAGGLSKRDVKQRLWELTRMPARHLSVKEILRAQASRSDEYGEIKPETLLSISRTPDDIWFIVAGGPGTHSVYVPCFGNSRAVTREIL
ncbi:MAG TPA: hypothetical protein VK642_01330 [Burkholderiales bacterium]|nr:hypothetical protein [Burkholderiales bacterium]